MIKTTHASMSFLAFIKCLKTELYHCPLPFSVILLVCLNFCLSSLSSNPLLNRRLAGPFVVAYRRTACRSSLCDPTLISSILLIRQRPVTSLVTKQQTHVTTVSPHSTIKCGVCCIDVTTCQWYLLLFLNSILQYYTTVL